MKQIKTHTLEVQGADKVYKYEVVNEFPANHYVYPAIDRGHLPLGYIIIAEDSYEPTTLKAYQLESEVLANYIMDLAAFRSYWITADNIEGYIQEYKAKHAEVQENRPHQPLTTAPEAGTLVWIKMFRSERWGIEILPFHYSSYFEPAISLGHVFATKEDALVTLYGEHYSTLKHA